MGSNFKNVEKIRKQILRRDTVLYVDKDSMVSFRGGDIIYSRCGETLSFRLPISSYQRLLIHFRIIERLLRLTPRCAEKIGDGIFLISFRGKVYKLDAINHRFVVEHEYRSEMNNPLAFTRVKDVKGFDDGVLYGEYFMNPDKAPVHVWHRDEAGEWSRVYTFDGNITHIHNIIPDPRHQCMYILTGDESCESAIWKASDNFKYVEPLVIGSQQNRSCVAFVEDDGIIYATDTPLDNNAIYYVSEGNVKKVYDMPGPCIYGTSKNGKMYFATSVEPDSTLPAWRYFMTYKLGKGVKNRFVHIVAGNVSDGFYEIVKFKKDLWPMTLFQFGNVQFPYDERLDEICMTATSVRKYDGKSILMKI